MSVVRARRSRSTVLTAATLGVLLATGAVLSSPAAYAAEAPAAATAPAAPAAEATADKPSLKVNAPATVGRGGQPVEFAETITNPGTTEASFTLRIGTSGAGPIATHAIKVDYRDADGTWKPVADTVPGLTVAAGATRTVQLRLTTELAAYWSNQDSTVTLSSAVLDATGTTVLAESTDQVAAKAITVQVKDAPTTAVAGGAPVEFDVTVNNPSASRYTTVDKVVEADKHSTLQVRKADGSWENITGTASSQPGSDRVTYHLTDDRTIAAGSSDTRHVRFAFTADAPLGTAYIHPWAMLDQGAGAMQAIVGPQFVAIDVTAAPVAAKPALTIQEPAPIGYGGEPVEFSETVTNPGTTEAPFTLKLNVSNVHARVHDAFAIEYRDADGTWKPVELTFKQSDKTFNFSGKVTGLTVPAGATRTFQLRLAAVGNNDTGGYSLPTKLYSAVVDPAAEDTVLAEATKDVAVKSLVVQLKNAPTTAVAGGAPVEFDVAVNNPSASRYGKLATILWADSHSVLEMQKADGAWETVPGTPGPQAGGPVRYLLSGDALAAGATITKHVRLAYTAEAKVGQTSVDPSAVINEGTAHAASASPQGNAIQVTTDTSGIGTGPVIRTSYTTGTADETDTTSTTGTTGTTGTTQLAGGELAHTGSDGVIKTAAGAAALLVSGIGALFVARRRRSA
ncbi:hypothetical protein ACFVHI_11800 [Kitasatospora sp. NPDC127121]|uniref:hypothetical protein n=1 Tax=Kitasatospora sp. NPDC127121 TaxID=3345371 RepID=UPI0036305F4A